jgi:hypothetical protein
MGSQVQVEERTSFHTDEALAIARAGGLGDADPWFAIALARSGRITDARAQAALRFSGTALRDPPPRDPTSADHIPVASASS